MKVPSSLSCLLALSLSWGSVAGAVEPQAPGSEPQASAAESQASAPEPASPLPEPLLLPPQTRLFLSSLTVVRYNPLGLETQNRLVYQRRLFDSSELLFRDTFASAAASLKASPAYVKVGPMLELQPLTVLNLRAGYEYVRFFGTMGFLQSYPGPFHDFSDDVRDATRDGAYSTSGHHLLFEPTVQAKVKSVALRSKLAVEYWNVNLRDGAGGTFYDATLDTLVPGKGWVLANDTDLLYLGGAWTVGARFSAVWPRYGEDASLPANFKGNSHMRVGPLVAYSFHTRENSSFNRPTLLVIAGWYLQHPNRAEAMPYLLAGFSFSSDLMPSRR
ncbi:hypothetical protein KRR26_11550 [Corallococcus sp. M34]|uniref:hypothetical protein n=1 Tax=Citreicoccus inhibens TaxID=2849499 RepID=UPI001C23811C|nr:hypothetical protein [Citreicoccus inhibens]MBU8896245.1 hypothetical protein [Citreicoccus inhibens]